MTQHPTIARWKRHYERCAQCRDAFVADEFCATGAPLRRAAITALYETPTTGRWPRIIVLAGVILILVTVLLLVSCAPAAQEPRLVAPELVRVIVQTERSLQLQHNDDRIETVRADGWPVLATPIVVCASFTGQDAASAPPRVARLWDREACRGALVRP